MTKIITYADDVDFTKKLKSLKKYSMKSYKYLLFDFATDVKKDTNGKYEKELPTESNLKRVYGPMKIVYSVKENIVLLENLNPDDFLLDGYNRELDCFNGIPYRNDQDLFKIKILCGGNK